MSRFGILPGTRVLVLLMLPFSAAMAQNHSSDTSATMNIPKPPATKQQPVTDDYFGHKVVDPYRWLEDGSSPETQQWVAEQLAYTRSVLDKLPAAPNYISGWRRCSRSATSVTRRSAPITTSIRVAKARRTSRCSMCARALTDMTRYWST
jgi:hypothetical protein